MAHFNGGPEYRLKELFFNIKEARNQEVEKRGAWRVVNKEDFQ